MQNIFTIDLEDWYQTESYRSKISISSWDAQHCKLLESTLEMLFILRKYNTKATFFILAYNVKRHKEIISLIKRDNHEIALHGYYHNLVFRQKPLEFRKEVEYSKKLLEDIYRTKIIGFRAPNWSIFPSCSWALEILRDLNFLYDSSMNEGIFKRNKYKIPKDLLEVPRSTIDILYVSMPFAGGFFLRAYPYWLTRYLIRRKNYKNEEALVYTHPWEIENKQVLPRLSFLNEIKSSFRLSCTRNYLLNLLKDFKFNSIKNIFFNQNNDKT